MALNFISQVYFPETQVYHYEQMRYELQIFQKTPQIAATRNNASACPTILQRIIVNLFQASHPTVKVTQKPAEDWPEALDQTNKEQTKWPRIFEDAKGLWHICRAWLISRSSVNFCPHSMDKRCTSVLSCDIVLARVTCKKQNGTNSVVKNLSLDA